MKYGAQNRLVGKVVEIKKGKLMCQVRVRVRADAMMCSVMTLDSLQDLGLKKGDQVGVLAKAVNVLLTKD